MRRIGFFAGLAVLALIISIADAQSGVMFRGVPASVTSIRPNNPTPGIPASVTSPINVPFQQFNRPVFISNNPTPLFHHRHFVPVPVPVPVYYPVYSYPVSDETPVTYPDQQQAQQPVEIIEVPAATAYDSHPIYQPASARPSASSALESAAEPSYESSTVPASPVTGKSKKEDQAPAPTEPTTVLVFRDGHMIEIGNYAIIGDTLYNLTSNFESHKIQLADLDLDKTTKINEDRGYEFRLPKPQGN